MECVPIKTAPRSSTAMRALISAVPLPTTHAHHLGKVSKEARAVEEAFGVGHSRLLLNPTLRTFCDVLEDTRAEIWWFLATAI